VAGISTMNPSGQDKPDGPPATDVPVAASRRDTDSSLGETLPRDRLETSLAAHLGALGAAIAFPTAATYLYFVVLSGRPAMSVLYGASKVLQFAFPLAWVVLVQRKRPALRRPELPDLAWGGGLGLLIVAVALAAYYGYFKHSPYLAEAPTFVAAKVRDMKLLTPGWYLSFALFLAVPHALLEEYYWRWFAFGQLRRITPLGLAVVASSLGFMAHHVIVIQQLLHGPWALSLFFAACVAIGGAAWAWLYQRRGSLYGPWISHFFVDAAIMYIGYDLIDWSAMAI
jgi:membrane protease YdiL (CAAX protease family)